MILIPNGVFLAWVILIHANGSVFLKTAWCVFICTIVYFAWRVLEHTHKTVFYL